MCHTVRKVVINRIDVMIIKTEAFEREFEQFLSEVIRIKKGSDPGIVAPFFCFNDFRSFAFQLQLRNVSHLCVRNPP